MSKSKILSFLKRDVPGSPLRMKEWRQDARALGPLAPAIFIQTLKSGSPARQYSALIALREFGYEAWAHGYWEKVTYSVAKPGQPTLLIKPAHTGYESPAKPKSPKSSRPSHPARAPKPTRRPARSPLAKL